MERLINDTRTVCWEIIMYTRSLVGHRAAAGRRPLQLFAAAKIGGQTYVRR